MSQNVMNPERAAKAAARRIGIPHEDYLAHRASGEKWCWAHREWHQLDTFPVCRSRRDGLANICFEARRIRYSWTPVPERFLCACDCGEEVNPKLRFAVEMQAAGVSHEAIARRLGVDRSYISALLRKPPRFLVGHYRLPTETRWRILFSNAIDRKLKHAATERWFVPLRQKREAERMRKVEARERKREAERMRKVENQVRCAMVRAQRRLMEAREKAQRKAERARQVQENRRETSLFYMCFELDAPIPGMPELTRGANLPDPLADPDRELAKQRLWEIVGDMRPEDVAKLDDYALTRLQDRLRAEGLASISVQESERKRLREPNRHAGASVTKVGSQGGGKRSRKAQQQVTRDHHIRELTTRQKREHAAFRRERVLDR